MKYSLAINGVGQKKLQMFSAQNLQINVGEIDPWFPTTGVCEFVCLCVGEREQYCITFICFGILWTSLQQCCFGCCIFIQSLFLFFLNTLDCARRDCWMREKKAEQDTETNLWHKRCKQTHTHTHTQEHTHTHTHTHTRTHSTHMYTCAPELHNFNTVATWSLRHCMGHGRHVCYAISHTK